MKKTYVVYILRCRDKSLYTGITLDLEHRLKMHASGKGAKYVRSRLPLKLVHVEKARTKSHALKREARIKSMTKKEKELLIKTPRVN